MTTTPQTATAADPATVVTLCAEAGLPALAAEMLGAGASLDQVQERLGAVTETRRLVELAHQANPAIDLTMADRFLAAGLPVEGVREALWETLLAAQSPEIINRTALGAVPQAGAPAQDHGWGRAVERVARQQSRTGA